MQVNDLHLYLKCHFPQMFFKHSASKNQQPGLSKIGTLVENGLSYCYETIQEAFLCLSEVL